MPNPRVSILTTVYNREAYLADCIESVLASDFKDWELILVDDGSIDTSVDIARTYVAKDNRIKLFTNEINLGDYPNRNKAASLAQGKYIKYLDADDMIYPHGLGLLVDSMEMFPEAALGISQEVAEDFQPYPFILQPRETYYRQFLKRGVFDLGPTGTIIRRDVFEVLGGFSGTRFIGDTEMWLKIAAKYSVVKTYPGLIYWRQHEGQEFDLGVKSYFYLENSFALNRKVLLESSPLNEADNKIAINKVQKSFARGFFNMLMTKKNFSQGQEILKRLNVSWLNIVRYIF